MTKPIKISALKSAIEKMGISISIDQLRKLTKAGVVLPEITKGGHRVFTEESFKKSLKNVLMYYFYVSIEDIKKGDPVVIADRVKLIKKSLKYLTI